MGKETNIGEAMLNPNFKSLRQQKVSTGVSHGRNRVTSLFGEAVGAQEVPPLSVPMIWARMKECLLFSGIFPPEAELTVEETAGDAILINCSWLLLDDPEFPDRRSTPIRILIQGDLADQFYRAELELLEQLNEALARIVARRLNRYRVDLGLPVHRTPPPFEIRVNLGLVDWAGRDRRNRHAA